MTLTKAFKEAVRMNRDEAFKEAVRRFGQGAIVGLNFNYTKQHHVGKKDTRGMWLKRGVGHSWEEAFENVVDYPDGKSPVTHGAKDAPDRH